MQRAIGFTVSRLRSSCGSYRLLPPPVRIKSPLGSKAIKLNLASSNARRMFAGSCFCLDSISLAWK